MNRISSFRRHRLADASRLYPAAIALIIAACVLLPSIAQDQSYHGFADQRRWLGVPNAADVLSNLAFALVGALGIARLVSGQRKHLAPATEHGMWCIAVGLICVAAGSAWYHLHPSDTSLAWDRLPMTLVFAGVVGTALAQRVQGHPGRWALPLLIVLGAGSVAYWRLTGDLSPYVTLQAGGIVALLWLLVATSNESDPFPWAWVIAWYALAKAAEALDRGLWDATHGLVAGHALKHLLAAMAGAAALWPILARRGKAGEG